MRIVAIEIPARDLEAQCAFYCSLLGFSRHSETTAAVELEIAGTYLRVFRAEGRRIPADSRSNDRWFRHLAVVVRDVDAAYGRLRAEGVEFVCEPVTLPHWNETAAGIRAVYLRDPEGHPVELLSFPPDKGHPYLQDDGREQFLGIDHTAIVVANADEAEHFYRTQAGLAVESRSHNFGEAQSALSGLPGADLTITSLRGNGGLGIELMQYAVPADGRPMPGDTTAEDLWSSSAVVASDDARAYHWSGPVQTDPDGHRLRFA